MQNQGSIDFGNDTEMLMFGEEEEESDIFGSAFRRPKHYRNATVLCGNTRRISCLDQRTKSPLMFGCF